MINTEEVMAWCQLIPNEVAGLVRLPTIVNQLCWSPIGFVVIPFSGCCLMKRIRRLSHFVFESLVCFVSSIRSSKFHTYWHSC